MPVHRVARFKEKPPASVAREYVAAGNYLWNAGIFVWKAATIIEALRRQQPDCLAHLERIINAARRVKGVSSVARRERLTDGDG